MFEKDFCKKYQIADGLLDKVGLDYSEVFRCIITNPPISKVEKRNTRREARHGYGSPIKSVFICYSNRSGSSYLADLLTLTGACGKPQEYFTVKNMERISRRFAVGLLEDYLLNLSTRRQSSNGVFATKTGFPELIFLHRHGLLEKYFPDPHYIMLSREDSVMQAVSWYRAAYQKTWSSSHIKRAEAHYDVDAIAHYHQLISQDARRWGRYFSIEGIAPLDLTYETLVADPRVSLARIAEYLELGVALEVDPGKSSFKIQRDATNHEWAERFRREARPPLP